MPNDNDIQQLRRDLTAAIAELNRQIAVCEEAKKKLDAVRENIKNVQQQLDAGGDSVDLDGLEKGIEAKKHELASLNESMPVLQAQLEEKKKQCGTLQADLKKMKTGTAGYEEEIQCLRRDIAGINSGIAELNKELADSERLKKEADAWEQRYESDKELRPQILLSGGTYTDELAAELPDREESEIRNLRGDIEELRGDIEKLRQIMESDKNEQEKR